VWFPFVGPLKPWFPARLTQVDGINLHLYIEGFPTEPRIRPNFSKIFSFNFTNFSLKHLFNIQYFL
jgi:hypothetical protein